MGAMAEIWSIKITIRTQAVVGGCRSCVRTLGTLEACWRSGRARRSETGALARAMALNICEDVWRKEEEGGGEEEEEEKTSRNEFQQVIGVFAAVDYCAVRAVVGSMSCVMSLGSLRSEMFKRTGCVTRKEDSRLSDAAIHDDEALWLQGNRLD
jgi:hypothetical protein